MLATTIFPFSHNVLFPFQKRFQLLAKSNLLSADAFNLDQSKGLLFGKELSIFSFFPTLLILRVFYVSIVLTQNCLN